MFEIFKNKKNIRKRRELIRKLELIIDEVFSLRSIEANVSLDNIKKMIDSPEIKLDENQLIIIEKYVLDIKKSVQEKSVDLILSKCEKIEKVVKIKNYNATDEEKQIDENKDNIIEIKAKIKNIHKKIDECILEQSEISKKIDKAKEEQKSLINNKVEWKKRFYLIDRLKEQLNQKDKELKSLEIQENIENRNLNMFITQNQNIQTAESYRNSAHLAEKIEGQKGIVNVEEAEINAEYFAKQNSIVIDNQKTLNEIEKKFYNKEIDSDELDAEVAYQRAVEESFIEEVKLQEQEIKY